MVRGERESVNSHIFARRNNIIIHEQLFRAHFKLAASVCCVRLDCDRNPQIFHVLSPTATSCTIFRRCDVNYMYCASSWEFKAKCLTRKKWEEWKEIFLAPFIQADGRFCRWGQVGEFSFDSIPLPIPCWASGRHWREKKLFSSEIVTFIIHGDIFNIENFPTWKKLLLLACPPLVMLSHPFNELPDLLLLCSASASFIPFDGSMGRAGEWKVKWKEEKCFKIEKKNGMKETRRRKINRKWDENKQEKLIRSLQRQSKWKKLQNIFDL